MANSISCKIGTRHVGQRNEEDIVYCVKSELLFLINPCSQSSIKGWMYIARAQCEALLDTGQTQSKMIGWCG